MARDMPIDPDFYAPVSVKPPPNYGEPGYEERYAKWKALQAQGIETFEWLAPPGYWAGVPYLEGETKMVFDDPYAGTTPTVPLPIELAPTPTGATPASIQNITYPAELLGLYQQFYPGQVPDNEAMSNFVTVLVVIMILIAFSQGGI